MRRVVIGGWVITLFLASASACDGTATPLDVQGPALGADEPVYQADQHSLVLRDDFNGYQSIGAALDAYPQGRGTEFGELTSGRGGSGRAFRLIYGTPSGADDVVFGPEGRLDRVGEWNGTLPERAGPYTHFFFSTWFRTSEGADPAQVDGSGVKGFMFWHSGGGRYQNAINRLQHPDESSRGPKGANPDNATSGLDLYKTADGRAPLWSRFSDGQWHRFTIEIFAGQDRTGNVGERYWIDGELVYDDVNRDAFGAAGHYDYRSPITHWTVWGNFVSPGARSRRFAIDFDDWIAWTD
jgi:hypothetical protein